MAKFRNAEIGDPTNPCTRCRLNCCSPPFAFICRPNSVTIFFAMPTTVSFIKVPERGISRGEILETLL
jgi:hypothetical protein